MPVLSKLDICQLIPHAGSMCLLDSVQEWGPSNITCLSSTHHDLQNPLRRGGHLEAICGLEYAAQAMAVHVRLVASPHRSEPQIGYIGAVRDCRLHVACLDEVMSVLEVKAVKLFAQDQSVIYELKVSAEGSELLSGRASLFLKKD